MEIFEPKVMALLSSVELAMQAYETNTRWTFGKPNLKQLLKLPI